MSDSILYVAKAKSSERRRDIDKQHHKQRFGKPEPHHSRRVNGCQRNDGRHAALVEKTTDDKVAKIIEIHERFRRLSFVLILRHGHFELCCAVHLRDGTLLEPQKHRNAHNQEHTRGDDIRCCHQGVHSKSLRLTCRHHRKTQTKRNQAADVTKRPAPT